MHGTVHSVDEVLNDHHAGRCAAIPIVPLAARLGIPEPDLGDAEQWLRSQPESVQQMMLGKGVYEGYTALGPLDAAQEGRLHRLGLLLRLAGALRGDEPEAVERLPDMLAGELRELG